MADAKREMSFSGLACGAAARIVKMLIDVPGGARRGEMGNVLAVRSQTGATTVTVT
jgi:hypothetical protein